MKNCVSIFVGLAAKAFATIFNRISTAPRGSLGLTEVLGLRADGACLPCMFARARELEKDCLDKARKQKPYPFGHSTSN